MERVSQHLKTVSPTAQVRLQLEGQRGRPQMGSQLYTGFLQCGRRVFAEEGLAGLWLPGLAATWARAYASTGVRIGLYPTVKRMLGASDGNASLPRQLAAGALTGCIGAALASPTDLVRVRLQVRGPADTVHVYRRSSAVTLAAFIESYPDAAYMMPSGRHHAEWWPHCRARPGAWAQTVGWPRASTPRSARAIDRPRR